MITLLIGLCGCTSPVVSSRSVADASVPRAQRGNEEARFQLYGPFNFLGQYRVQHEWLHEDPRGSHYCRYSSVREEVRDELGQKRPAQIGLDMWEEGNTLWQRAPYLKSGAKDMTDYVIGKYRPKAPGGPFYDHERLCRTYFEPYASEYQIWLKKADLAALRHRDEDDLAKRWNYANLIKPLNYESITFAGQRAERVVWTYSFAPKGLENNPMPLIKEDIRVPIGDTGYVYQLTFTLSDTIAKNEPDKAARRRAYWQRIQDTFRIELVR